MKLKHLPEDFQVEELTAMVPQQGPFAMYRLTKRCLGTPEAVEAILRRWRLSRDQVSYGGLKDRHAITHQSLTIRNGPRQDLKQTNLQLTYQGQVARPFEPADITANGFRIVLRDLSREDAARAQQALHTLQHDGLPNYFDRQRFGSVGQSREFIARAWCAGDYQRALWLALADPNSYDRSRQRAERKLLREHWGNWEHCQAALARSPRRKIIAHLAEQPGDFRGAMALIRSDLRRIYLSAFQSFLWNRMLAALLRQHCRAEQLFDASVAGQTVPFYRAIDENQRAALAATQLPLPSARTQLEEGSLKDLVDRVLGRVGLQLRDLQIDYPRDSFFSKGNRPAVFFATGVDCQLEQDDLYPDRQKMLLRFELPRGCYGTILIRRLFAV